MNKWYIWDYDDFINENFLGDDIDTYVVRKWKKENTIRGINNPKYFIAQDNVSDNNRRNANEWIRENFGDNRVYGNGGLTSFILESDEELVAFKLAIM